jgi:hypothetical protein
MLLALSMLLISFIAGLALFRFITPDARSGYEAPVDAIRIFKLRGPFA